MRASLAVLLLLAAPAFAADPLKADVTFDGVSDTLTLGVKGKALELHVKDGKSGKTASVTFTSDGGTGTPSIELEDPPAADSEVGCTVNSKAVCASYEKARLAHP